MNKVIKLSVSWFYDLKTRHDAIGTFLKRMGDFLFFFFTFYFMCIYNLLSYDRLQTSLYYIIKLVYMLFICLYLLCLNTIIWYCWRGLPLIFFWAHPRRFSIFWSFFYLHFNFLSFILSLPSIFIVFKNFGIGITSFLSFSKLANYIFST